jgi:hypothetical protein
VEREYKRDERNFVQERFVNFISYQIMLWFSIQGGWFGKLEREETSLKSSIEKHEKINNVMNLFFSSSFS